jgi:class 3 adenylate cyclase/pimeloyl-ACP methyl ester carboxylesterase
VDAPEARYVERDGVMLAYQVVGDHGPYVLWVGEIGQHFDLAWTDPHIHDAYERAATYSRNIFTQLRGFGLSEPINYVPTLEQQASDVVAILDELGIQQAVLVGILTTCAPVALVAARHPERVSALVLMKPLPCGPLTPTALEHEWTPETAADYARRWRTCFTRWGSGATVDVWDSVLTTSYNRRLMAMLERCSAMPAAAGRFLEYALHLDHSDVLRAVRVPTRVLFAPTGYEPETVVRHVAEIIPGATFHALPPTLPGASVGEAFEPVWRHVEEVATGGRHAADAGRFLGTILFTDVVGSTELLTRLGDAGYRELRSAYERQVRLQVERDEGRLVSVTGDGTLSVFDGPTRAVRCAEAICRDAAELGISVRAGVHTGEMERTHHDVTGLAVHIGARIGAAAAPGEVLVSQTVRDLVTGSGLAFTPRGTHTLKGVPGQWELFALAEPVAVADHAPGEPAADRSLETAMDRVALRTARTAPWAVRTALRVGNAVQRYRARAASAR